MGNITSKEAIEILSHYTDLGYGIVIEGEDTSKIKQALSFASKTLASGTPLYINVPSANCVSRSVVKDLISDKSIPIKFEEEKRGEWRCSSGVLLSDIYKVIDNAPPAPERPQGEWYYGEDECGQDGWFCSECDFFVPWYYEYYEKDIDFIREYKACPHCLAEMVTYTGKDRDTEYKVTETPSEIRVEPTPIERLKAPFERVKENLNKAFGIKQPGKVMKGLWEKGDTDNGNE